MTPEQDNEPDLKNLEPILEEYTGWFLQLVRRIFFPDAAGDKNFAAPESFSIWLKNAEGRHDPGTLAAAAKLHDEMLNDAEELIKATAKLHRPSSYKDFDKLATLFEEFIHSLGRFGQGAVQESGAGVDSLTGLRGSELFMIDIKREMDRLARQGKAFCIALIRIDEFEKIKKGLSPEALDECIKFVADLVKLNNRSFDDAYRLDESVFAASLKQTSKIGGMNALYRLKNEVREKNIVYKMKGGELQLSLSLSAIIAEPLAEDNIEQTVAHMKEDLSRQVIDSDTVLEYVEISPLQQFLREGRE